jgi:hypothetical protein
MLSTKHYLSNLAKSAPHYTQKTIKARKICSSFETWVSDVLTVQNSCLLAQHKAKPSPVNTVRSKIRCALSLLYADLVVSIEVAVAVCCCFTEFSC